MSAPVEICRKRMYGRSHSFSGTPCQHKAVEAGYCRFHCPSAIEKRRQKMRERDEIRNATWQAQRERRVFEAKALAAFPDLLHCLKVIVCHAEGRGLDASLHLDEARAAIAKAEGTS